MKLGTKVTVSDAKFDGMIGEVTYHNPEVWTEVKWEDGSVDAFEMSDVFPVEVETKVISLPEVEQPESGFNPLFVARVISKINDYQREYLECHPHDWDCCGFASVTVEFGRKKKIKEQVLALGFDVAYKSGTDSYLEPKFRIPYCGHQSLTYKEDITRIVCSVINEVVGEKIARMTSYVD